MGFLNHQPVSSRFLGVAKTPLARWMICKLTKGGPKSGTPGTPTVDPNGSDPQATVLPGTTAE